MTNSAMTLARLCLAATLGVSVGAGIMVRPALAQVESREGITLQNEILELRQQMANLQQLGNQAVPPSQSNLGPPEQEGGPPPGYAGGSGDAVAQLTVRVSALEEQVRTLEGRITELENTEHHDHDDLTKQIGDLAFKVGQGGAPAGEGAPAPGPDTLPPPGAAGTVPSVGDDGAGLAAPRQPRQPAIPPHRPPELALKQGNAALARRDYAAAEAAAREVLAMGHGAHTADANFLLAHAQAGQHQYQQAAATYYSIYKANPRTPRAAWRHECLNRHWRQGAGLPGIGETLRRISAAGCRATGWRGLGAEAGELLLIGRRPFSGVTRLRPPEKHFALPRLMAGADRYLRCLRAA
jgi:TolA-binding protein